MARISGVDIPKQKRGVISLTYIYGVGKSLAKKVLTLANVDENKKVNQWNDDEISRIRAEVSKLTIEGELRSETQLNIKRLMDIGSYRGIRHRTGLSLRGQKTKNNSRTRKGKRKTAFLCFFYIKGLKYSLNFNTFFINNLFTIRAGICCFICWNWC